MTASPTALAEPTLRSPWWLGWVAPLAAAAAGSVAIGASTALGADDRSTWIAVSCAGVPTLASLAVLRPRAWRLAPLAMALIGASLGRLAVSVVAAVIVIQALGLDRGSFVWSFLGVAFAALVAEKTAGVLVLRPAIGGPGASPHASPAPLSAASQGAVRS